MRLVRMVAILCLSLLALSGGALLYGRARSEPNELQALGFSICESQLQSEILAFDVPERLQALLEGSDISFGTDPVSISQHSHHDRFFDLLCESANRRCEQTCAKRKENLSARSRSIIRLQVRIGRHPSLPRSTQVI